MSYSAFYLLLRTLRRAQDHLNRRARTTLAIALSLCARVAQQVSRGATVVNSDRLRADAKVPPDICGFCIYILRLIRGQGLEVVTGVR